jgi:hypothetical protein
LDICPTLVHFVATLEQQFLTIDDLLGEEAIDTSVGDATAKDIVTMNVSLDKTPFFELAFMTTHHSTLELTVSTSMRTEPCVDSLQCVDDGDEFCATSTMRRNTDAADGDDSAMQLTISRALDELYAYIPNIQDPDSQGTFMWPVDSSIDSIPEQDNARLLTRPHG